jgi:hypothetical protein
MLQYAHTRNTSSLDTMMDSELWKQADVPRQVQTVADAIAAAVSAAPSAAVIQRATAAVGSDEGGGSSAQDGGGVALALASAPPAKVLSANGQSFVVVGTGVMLVKYLGDYVSVAEAIPDVAGDAISCTVQLLRQFNSRATQLVLGAGAIQTASLKRITAKHLALTSQTLGAVLALLPSIRAVLLMRLAPHQHVLLADLANVTADILAHDNRIRAKFVAIVKDLVVKCLGDMGRLPWGDAEAALTLPSPPMAELTNGIATLYRILRSVFRPDQLADIFARILVMLNSQLPGQTAALVSHLVLDAQQRGMSAAASASASGTHAAAPPRFSRDVATKRLAVDLRGFLAEMRALADSCMRLDDGQPSAADAVSGGGSASSSSSSKGSQLPEASAAAVRNILAPGTDALAAMSAWVTQQYGAEEEKPDAAQAAGEGTASMNGNDDAGGAGGGGGGGGGTAGEEAATAAPVQDAADGAADGLVDASHHVIEEGEADLAPGVDGVAGGGADDAEGKGGVGTEEEEGVAAEAGEQDTSASQALQELAAMEGSPQETGDEAIEVEASHEG